MIDKLIQKKTLSLLELASLRDRSPGRKLVQCHGVFDVLHIGHLYYFESARSLGDVLIVTITHDRFVRKGPGRPRFPVATRLKMIAALELVDFVSVSDFATASESIRTLRPDFYVKGPDYRDKESDLSRGIFEEEAAVISVGGELRFTSDRTESSSKLIQEFFSGIG